MRAQQDAVGAVRPSRPDASRQALQDEEKEDRTVVSSRGVASAKVSATQAGLDSPSISMVHSHLSIWPPLLGSTLSTFWLSRTRLPVRTMVTKRTRSEP